MNSPYPRAEARRSKLACFDFDGTLTSSNIIHQIIVIKFAYYAGLKRYLWLFGFVLSLPVYFYWYKRDAVEFNRRIYRQFRGLERRRLEQIVDERVVPFVLLKVFADAHLRIADYRQRGYELMVISASWHVVVSAVAARLGIRHCQATTLEEVDGVLTGEIVRLVDGEEKSLALTQFCRDYGDRPGHIEVFGNSSWDIPMLEQAGRAHVVNPGRALTAWANANDAESHRWKHPRLHWSVFVFYPLAYLIVSRCEGLEEIPKTGGALIIANHTSYLDHFVLYSLVARHVRRQAKFVAKVEHFKNPMVSRIITSLGAFPIDRQRGGRTALSRTVEMVNRGELVVIYPEGTRSRDGELKAFKAGIVFVQDKTGCPIVPAAIHGAYAMWPARNRIPRPGRIHVKFGSKIDQWDPSDLASLSPLGVQKKKLDTLHAKVQALFNAIQ
ncbi:HAD-IB family phosphatase [Thiosocius teredinicola]|uniref:HAD-IB family phosphatase n=1 Tax=Thiosocius teredinicola TaxID=1973002 RepID=UPI00099115E6